MHVVKYSNNDVKDQYLAVIEIKGTMHHRGVHFLTVLYLSDGHMLKLVRNFHLSKDNYFVMFYWECLELY